jgi:hypothetical protein
MSFSNTQVQGQGHTITPPAEVTPSVPLTQRQQVDVVGAEYGAICVDAVNAAMSARGNDADRAAAVPSANG